MMMRAAMTPDGRRFDVCDGCGLLWHVDRRGRADDTAGPEAVGWCRRLKGMSGQVTSAWVAVAALPVGRLGSRCFHAKSPRGRCGERPIRSACQGVTTGSFSQPRTVEVRACTALSQSTSHSGKRCSTSSSATRPSRRASAAPRQKWMP